MPVNKETETKQVQSTTTTFQCDKEGCAEESGWIEDMNLLAMNPRFNQLRTQLTKDKLVDWDGVIILCDQHAEETDELLSDAGLEFHDGNEARPGKNNSPRGMTWR